MCTDRSPADCCACLLRNQSWESESSKGHSRHAEPAIARFRDGWTIFVAQSVTQRQTIAQLEFILRVQRVFLVAPQIVRAGEGVVVGLEKTHVHFGGLGTSQIHGLVGRAGS